jgi:enoyl-CoA hydratase
MRDGIATAVRELEGAMAEVCIEVEKRGPALCVVLNRPEVLNSINLALVDDLSSFLDRLERDLDPDVRALVLTGAGRAFCAGGDLGDADDGEGRFATAAPLFGGIGRVLDRLEALPLPVIAAVNGLAVAGGLEIVLACDLVIAAENARFGDGHANFGLLPGGGGSVRLPRKIGMNRAKQMMMTAATFPVRTMAEWGLVNDIVPASELLEKVDALVVDLAQKSALGLARMKHLLDTGMQQPVKAALAAEHSLCALHDFSYDRNEGLRAFAMKRPPRFEGR